MIVLERKQRLSSFARLEFWNSEQKSFNTLGDLGKSEDEDKMKDRWQRQPGIPASASQDIMHFNRKSIQGHTALHQCTMIALKSAQRLNMATLEDSSSVCYRPFHKREKTPPCWAACGTTKVDVTASTVHFWGVTSIQRSPERIMAAPREPSVKRSL